MITKRPEDYKNARDWVRPLDNWQRCRPGVNCVDTVPLQDSARDLEMPGLFGQHSLKRDCR
jgi:hypothetical protein